MPPHRPRQALLAARPSAMKIVGVTGHQQIPPEALRHIEEGIARLLATDGGELIGVSSLAAGADQLFARVVLQKGGRLHAVIPCERYETAFTDHAALETFRRLLGQAAEIETLPNRAPSQRAFLQAGRRVVDLAEVLIAVWDSEQARGQGGTADVVSYARERHREIVVVWPAGVSR